MGLSIVIRDGILTRSPGSSAMLFWMVQKGICCGERRIFNISSLKFDYFFIEIWELFERNFIPSAYISDIINGVSRQNI